MKYPLTCLSTVLAFSVASVFVACSPAATTGTPNGTPTDGGGGGTDSGNNNPDGGTTSDGGNTNDGGSTNDGGTTGDGGGPGLITSCADAVLYAGNPYFNGTLGGWNPAGQEKLADPPLRSENLTAVGSTVYIDTNQEVWRTEGTKVLRVAGDETDNTSAYNPVGTCAQSRFLIVKGVAALPNGNVLVVDVRGNGIVEIQNPTGTCMVAPYAGNPVKTLDTDISGEAASPGDVVGPGATAQFNGLGLPTVDAQGNVYVVDTGNAKIKKIANDAAHTVSTLYKYPTADQQLVMAMTALNGKLYISGGTSIDDFLWEVDTTTGTQKSLYQGRGIFPDIDSTKQAVIFALTNDGTSLLAGSNKGYIYRMGLDGKNPVELAGMGTFADYPTGIDLTKPVASANLPLRGVGVNNNSLIRIGSDLYWTGTNGVGFHVWDLRCK